MCIRDRAHATKQQWHECNSQSLGPSSHRHKVIRVLSTQAHQGQNSTHATKRQGNKAMQLELSRDDKKPSNRAIEH
eukprot:6060094-Amphidinium_carterae.2